MDKFQLLSDKLQNKYKYTAFFYDVLDYPWERMYRDWRAELLKEVTGQVLEAGVGTGRNLIHYDKSVKLTAIDLSPQMISRAKHRAKKALCDIEFMTVDASKMIGVSDNHYDWFISTFLCCVMPNALQPQTIEQMALKLKPGGRFKILEMVFSKDEKTRHFQNRVMPFVEFVYGARFDRNTLQLIEQHPALAITRTSFLKEDTYLLIEGTKKGN